MSLTPIPTTEITKVTRDPRKRVHQEAYADKLGKYVLYSADKSHLTFDAAGLKAVPFSTADDKAAMLQMFMEGVVCIYSNAYYTAQKYDATNGITFNFPS